MTKRELYSAIKRCWARLCSVCVSSFGAVKGVFQRVFQRLFKALPCGVSTASYHNISVLNVLSKDIQVVFRADEPGFRLFGKRKFRITQAYRVFYGVHVTSIPATLAGSPVMVTAVVPMGDPMITQSTSLWKSFSSFELSCLLGKLVEKARFMADEDDQAKAEASRRLASMFNGKLVAA